MAELEPLWIPCQSTLPGSLGQPRSARVSPCGLRGLVKANPMCAQNTAQRGPMNPCRLCVMPPSCLPEPSPPSSPQELLCRATGRRVGYKENLATGKSVFEDLTGHSVGAVHLASLPPVQASGMLVQPTSRGESQPPALCQCKLCTRSGRRQEGGRGRPEENREKEVLQKSYLLHKASPAPSRPWPHSLLKASRTFIRQPISITYHVYPSCPFC